MDHPHRVHKKAKAAFPTSPHSALLAPCKMAPVLHHMKMDWPTLSTRCFFKKPAIKIEEAHAGRASLAVQGAWANRRSLTAFVSAWPLEILAASIMRFFATVEYPITRPFTLPYFAVITHHLGILDGIYSN